MYETTLPIISISGSVVYCILFVSLVRTAKELILHFKL